MSKPKFTPGPWRVNYSDIQAKDYDSSEFNLTVARINAFSASREEQLEEIANAALIAAAPEMYEALENILAYLNQDPTAGDVTYAVSKVEQALAKARGES